MYLYNSYNGAVRLVSEQDCCRIITSTSCEILQRVPSSIEAVRRIGSTDAAALMYDAMEVYRYMSIHVFFLDMMKIIALTVNHETLTIHQNTTSSTVNRHLKKGTPNPMKI
jgi:hypothetical protein